MASLQVLPRQKYVKPLLEKVGKMVFPMEIINNSTIVICKQCSSCHGCR